jgi:hypothetical protein
MSKFKTLHYWAIHRRVARREWQNLDLRSRDVIAADSEHTSREYKNFERYVASETERLYQDSSYYMNDPYSFRYSQYES